MDSITDHYLARAGLCLAITTLAYFLMNGAQLFETFVSVPKWTTKPPASLSALQGPYAPDLKTFWIIAHSIHEITFIIAIILCWRLPQLRFPLLTIFFLHFAVRVWTILYFAPHIISFQKVDTNIASPEIEAAVYKWRILNYVRVAAFVGLSVWMAVVASTVWKISQMNDLNSKNPNMEQRLNVITLGVENLKAQAEFYNSKIGWKSVAENKDIIFFKMNGFLFSLFDRKALAESSGVKAESDGFRSIVFSYNVSQKDQVDELYREFKTKGIAILKTPSATPFGGYYFVFSDPENNVLEVAYNPYIPLDEAGNVITHKNIDNL